MADQIAQITELVEEVRRLLGPTAKQCVLPKKFAAFALGEPVEVVVSITGRQVEICLPVVMWTTPYSPTLRGDPVTTIEWDRSSMAEAAVQLLKVVKMVRQQRLHTFRNCRFCHENQPPEWMHQEDVCQGCAEKYLGIVH